MVKIQMCQSAKENEIEKYDSKDFIAEKKFDGSRMIYRYGEFFTTNRMDYGLSRNVSYKLPELAQEKPVNAILDGEVVAESGKFEDTGSRIHMEDTLGIRIGSKKNPVIYYVFDILEIDGNDVSQLPLSKRKELLKAVKFDNPRLQIVDYTDDIVGLWEKIKKEKGEGIVIKNLKGCYDKGRRSFNWLKLKNWKEDIVIVNSYTENPKGLRLEMDNGQGLQCAGTQSIAVKEAIDSMGSVRIEIQYLTRDKKAGGKDDEYVYRFPSYKRMCGDVE